MTEQASSCLFCRIVAGEIPADIVERGATWCVFRDVAPQAPEHLLVVPTRHVPNLSSYVDKDELAEVFTAAARLGRRVGGEEGYRLVTNEGVGAGQSVMHLHVHVLAGRPLRWPPG